MGSGFAVLARIDSSYCYIYFPTLIRFPMGGERVTCMPKDEQNSLTPKGNNNLNFRFARDQVVHLETAANLCASRVKKIIFCSHGS